MATKEELEQLRDKVLAVFDAGGNPRPALEEFFTAANIKVTLDGWAGVMDNVIRKDRDILDVLLEDWIRDSDPNEIQVIGKGAFDNDDLEGGLGLN